MYAARPRAWLAVVGLVLGGGGGVAWQWAVRCAETGSMAFSAIILVMESALFLMLGPQEVAGSRYNPPILFLSAHSLALALAFIAALFNPLYPCGTLALVDILGWVGGDARVRIQDRQV